MRIALKLTAGFVLIAALVGLVGYFTGTAGREIQSQLEQLSRSAIVKVVDGANMASALDTCHRAAWALLAESRQARPSGGGAIPSPRIEEARREVDEALDQFRQSLERSRMAADSLLRWTDAAGEPELAERERLTTVRSLDVLDDAFSEYRRLVEHFLVLAEADAGAAGEFLRVELLPHFNRSLLPVITEFRLSAEADFTRGVRTAERATVTANQRNSLLTIVAMIGALGLGLIVSRSIGQRLGRMERAVLSVGEGDLDTRVPPGGRDEIGLLGVAFNRMVADLREKTVSKAYADSIIGSMREILVVTDSDRRIRRVNSAALAELGFAEEELVGKPVEVLLAPEDAGLADHFTRETAGEGHERVLRTKDGGRVPVYCSVAPLRDASGRAQGFVCVALNLAQRKAAEEQLRASLAEKELLLREVHHRVKNNLQVISSLLSLQTQEAADPRVAELFQESQGRIRSMALIHEQLYRSGMLAQVDFAEYLEQLTTQLAGTFDAAGQSIRLKLSAEPIPLPLDLAIPCGMIVNELVSNAMKHAFPQGEGGEIEVRFRREQDQYVLLVCDDGIGVPPASGSEKPETLGMRVVEALVRQLGGAYQTERQQGTAFTVRFG